MKRKIGVSKKYRKIFRKGLGKRACWSYSFCLNCARGHGKNKVSTFVDKVGKRSPTGFHWGTSFEQKLTTSEHGGLRKIASKKGTQRTHTRLYSLARRLRSDPLFRAVQLQLLNKKQQQQLLGSQKWFVFKSCCFSKKMACCQ